MGRIINLTIGLALSASVTAETTSLATLDDLRWKNRVILVDGFCEQAVEELKAREASLDERQLVWFCLDRDDIHTNFTGTLDAGFAPHLRETFFGKTGASVLLIGKDGGIKSRDSSLSLDQYLMQIDSMPMRQAEMRPG